MRKLKISKNPKRKMSKNPKRKKGYVDLYKIDEDKNDIFIRLPSTPIKWIKYNFECKEGEEIAIDIRTGKASVRKCKED